jgi:hypothetical protein
MKKHGSTMSMSPANGGGVGSQTPKSPSGTGYPAVSGSSSDGSNGGGEDDTGSHVIASPMPVVLTWGTIIKFASVIMIPFLTGISFAIYFFHKTNLHMDDPTVHLSRGERGKLETKAEAATARKKLEKSISRELGIRAREIKQDIGDQQKIQFKKLGRELKSDQRHRFDQILKEIKQSRRGPKP